ncbi:hypothetical protein COLO4_15695 [Corchorus olitorius]|uniref:Uncharacterized protein n=1 Tax=Corchorus olitorius TaxID=93759 RepID=A0A1R3JLG8_9ROSI|nr:hypothetical protein COLO4_15695 [Corchorus olitorius]
MTEWTWELRMVKMRSNRALLLDLNQSLKEATTSLAFMLRRCWGDASDSDEEWVGGDWGRIKQEYEYE